MLSYFSLLAVCIYYLKQLQNIFKRVRLLPLKCTVKKVNYTFFDLSSIVCPFYFSLLTLLTKNNLFEFDILKFTV